MAQKATQGFKELYLTALTDTKTTDVEGVGVLRQEGDKFYRWVYNADASALVAGQPVCYTLSNNETLHEAVDTPATANLAFLAGLAISAIPTLNYGWVLIEGWYESAYAVNSVSDAVISAGDILAPTNGASALAHHKAAAAVSANAYFGYAVAAESRASGVAGITASSIANTDVWVHCRNV